jgi:DNA-directed RNA polymerase specialized sigma24 family protein
VLRAVAAGVPQRPDEDPAHCIFFESEPDPARAADQHERLLSVLAALGLLDEEQNRLVRLWLDGIGWAGIAHELGVCERTAQRRWEVVLARLRTCMQP